MRQGSRGRSLTGIEFNPSHSTVAMRSSLRLLMASAMPSKGMTPGPMALLPPIYLYRRLLRAHRKHLPSEMRLLGDEYVKAEFRAHRDVENPVHLVGQPQQSFPIFDLASEVARVFGEQQTVLS